MPSIQTRGVHSAAIAALALLDILLEEWKLDGDPAFWAVDGATNVPRPAERWAGGAGCTGSLKTLDTSQSRLSPYAYVFQSQCSYSIAAVTPAGDLSGYSSIFLPFGLAC